MTKRALPGQLNTLAGNRRIQGPAQPSKSSPATRISSPGSGEMSSDQIAKIWRKYLFFSLQERYGLEKDDARLRVNTWLRRLRQYGDSRTGCA